MAEVSYFAAEGSRVAEFHIKPLAVVDDERGAHGPLLYGLSSYTSITVTLRPPDRWNGVAPRQVRALRR